MDTGKNELSDWMFEKIKQCISNKEYSKSEDVLYLVEGETITDNHNRRLVDHSIFKLHGKMLRGTSDEGTRKFQEYVESETEIPPYEMITIDSVPELIKEQAEYDAMMYGDTYIFGVGPKKLITGCTQNFKTQRKLDALEAVFNIIDVDKPDRNGRIWQRDLLMRQLMGETIYLIPPRHHKSWMWLKFLQMQSYEIQHKPLVIPPSKKIDLYSVIHMRWPKPDLSDLKPEVGKIDDLMVMDYITDTFGPIDQMTMYSFMKHWPEMLKQGILVGPNFNEDKKRLERVIKKGRKRK
jgi:hypothetical protein